MRAPLSAGQLTERVTLQRRAAGQDASGQASGAWEDQFTEWAQVTMLRTTDLLQASQPVPAFDAEVRMHYRSDILPTDRIIWRSQALEISGLPVDVDSAGHTLLLRVRRGVRDGR